MSDILIGNYPSLDQQVQIKNEEKQLRKHNNSPFKLAKKISRRNKRSRSYDFIYTTNDGDDDGESILKNRSYDCIYTPNDDDNDIGAVNKQQQTTDNKQQHKKHNKRARSTDLTQTNSNDTNNSQTMKELMEKYKAKQHESTTITQNLLNKANRILESVDDPHFPKIEQFIKEYKEFMNETHNNLRNALMDILKEIIKNEDDDLDTDLKHNEDDVNTESIGLQQISYEIIHDIIIKCYKEMEKRRNIYKLNGIKDELFIHYLQIKWDSFIKNKYYTMKLSQNHDRNDDDNIDDIIDRIYHSGIYDETKVKFVESTNTRYSVPFMLLKMRKSMDIRVFISRCCGLFWIMMLYKKKTLKLSHYSFWIDLKKRNDSNMIYCGIPGVILQNKKGNNEIMIEPHIFCS